MAIPLSTCVIVLRTNRCIAIRSRITLKLNTVPVKMDRENTIITQLTTPFYNCKIIWAGPEMINKEFNHVEWFTMRNFRIKKNLEICNHVYFSEVEAAWWKPDNNKRTYQADQPQLPWWPIITTGYKGNQQQTPKDITKMYLLRPEVYIKDPFLTQRFKLIPVQPCVENTKCFIELTSHVKCGCQVWTLL